jgi:hypothetical protein
MYNGMGAVGKAMRSAAVIAASAAGNLWPGLTSETGEEFVRIGKGMPLKSPNKFAQITQRFYHRQDYATGGANLLTFFNASISEHTTNVNNGILPDDRPSWITGISVDFQDITTAGARPASSAAAQLSSATGGAAFTRAEEIRTILQGGLLQMYVADRMIHEGQNLMRYPTGGGFAVDALQLTQASAAASQSAVWNNGIPHANNLFKLPRPYPWLPGKALKVLLKWPAALSITTATALKVEIVAEQVVPLNQ